jgi:hypothetical protein
MPTAIRSVYQWIKTAVTSAGFGPKALRFVYYAVDAVSFDSVPNKIRSGSSGARLMGI